MKINDKIIRSKFLIEKVFLNYEFLYELFKNQYFNVSNYCLNFDFIDELISFLSKTEHLDNEFLIASAALIQSVCISQNDSLNKYPNSIATQLCSRIRCLSGLSKDFTKFIKDCDELSPKTCALIAPCQLMPLCDARIRLVHNFFREIIDYQDLGAVNGINKGFYLYNTNVGIFNWNSDGSKKSDLAKEIELPENCKYKLLRVFQYKQNLSAYGIIVATDSSIFCLNDNGQEISKQKVNEGEKVKDIVLVGDRGFIVFYENKDYFCVFETHCKENSFIHKQPFESCISFICYNGKNGWGWSNSNDALYLAVFLENSEINIFDVYEDASTKIISLNQIFKHLVKPKPISGAFQQGVYDNACKFRFFATFESNKFLLIELKSNNQFLFQGIKPNMMEEDRLFNVLSYDSNFAVLTDDESTYFYDTKAIRWFKIGEVYKDVDIFDGVNGFCKIYAYNEKYLDVYLIKLYQKNFEIVKLINKFQFMDEIQMIACDSKC